MNPVDKSANQPQFIVTLNRNITLFTVLALPLLCSLGIWQLNRATEKRELQAEYTQQQAQSPVTLTGDNIDKLRDYRRVLVQGVFDNDHTWLLDNKQRHGRVGYEIISPFILDDGHRILINRGWLAGEKTRAALPQIERIEKPVTLFADLASVTEHPLLDAKNTQQGWPKTIMAIELEAMAQHLGESLLPRYLRLDESSPGAFATEWQPINTSPEKHLGYAVQWFAMALALMIWFVFANSNLLNYWRQRREHKRRS